MAKEAKQVELELDDKKKTEDTDGKTEVIITGQEDKSQVKVEENDIEKKLKELQDKLAKSDEARKLSDEKASRLEKERSEANAKAQKAEGKAASTQKDAILQALATSEESLNIHRAAYKAALESADSEKAVEAQEKFAEAKYLNSELKKNKVAFEAWEKQQEEEAKKPKEVSLPPAVQEWINKNPRYTSDQDYKDEADAAHDVALRRGYGFGTSAYIKFIDDRLQKMFPEEKLASEQDKKPEDKGKKDVAYSAPPNRGSSTEDNGSVNGGNKYRLTAEEVEAAVICGFASDEKDEKGLIEYYKTKKAGK